MKILKVLGLVLLCFACSQKTSVKSGDIVFREAMSSNLSKAINEVTQTSKSTNYTHMGICEVVNDNVMVYHSDLGKGVVKEPLESFVSSSDTLNYMADVYRIKKLDAEQAQNALAKAKSLLGNPYNTTYVLEDEGYYCSEFIYELFKKDSVFKLEPMTFKNPDTDEFHLGWIEHYKALGIEIPEGKLGCNPNGMASNKRLKFVKHIQ